MGKRWRPSTPDELERKAQGAADYPSFLSGLCPGLHHHRTPKERALVDAVLAAANRAWWRVRGSVLPLAVVLCTSAAAHAGVDPWAVGPLAVGQSADLVSTQRALAVRQWDGSHLREQNPLPWMHATGGRVAWSAAELSGVAWLSTRSRKAGRVVGWAVAIAHVVFAAHNERNRSRAIAAGAR